MDMKTTMAAVLLGAMGFAGPVAADAVAASPADGGAAIQAGAGATLTPPEGWTVVRQGALLRFTPPEKDLNIVILPVEKAVDGKTAAAQAWKLADPAFAWPIHLASPLPARNGWDEAVQIDYEVPPAAKAIASAFAYRRGTAWTVMTVAGATATIDKRYGQFSASAETLRPAGYVKESFAGKTAHRFDATRIALLKNFVAQSMGLLKVPGVGLAIVDHGTIVYEGGLGVKDVATKAPVDKDTLFMIASNTKGMATLLLATLVDDGRLDWNRPVIDYMPDFRLGDAETTRKVLVKHLVCACTGLPRKDMQWLFNTRPDTAAGETFTQLAATQPTSGFGEMFQYNNLMASAAGYLGAHILHPDMEIGAAFDRSMQERIFGPLGMRSTILNNGRAMAGNWAKPYDVDLAGNIAPVDTRYNDTVVPYRPAGGAWSSAHDMALYVRNELTEGALPGGKRLVSAENLLARRVHNVPVGENIWYGMGLEDDASAGVSVIQHGGSMFGYKSNWFAVPSAQVGVVVLTNAESGYGLANGVKRRMLEILYDGKPEAVENIALEAGRLNAEVAKLRAEVDPKVSPEVVKSLAGSYRNADLGPLSIGLENGRLMARATSIWSEIGTRRNKDGTLSLVMISPGNLGMEFLVTTRDGKPALALDDAQHEYVFTPSDGR